MRAATRACERLLLLALDADAEYTGLDELVAGAAVFFCPWVDFDGVWRALSVAAPAGAGLASRPNERQTAAAIATGPVWRRREVMYKFC
jgi:hypothetical protein